MKKLLLVLLLILSAVSLHSQTTKEEFFLNEKNAGGLYFPYTYVPSTQTPPPAGYTPFYMSHYGRHGSRWTITQGTHTMPLKILTTADSLGKLTATGKKLLANMKIIAEDAFNRYGDLTPLGVVEHRAIAERMYKSFPEIFAPKDGKKVYIYSRSTQVPRCILSMAANNERLKELNPQIEITRDASKKFTYLNNGSGVSGDSVRAITNSFLKKNFPPARFINSVFNDSVYAKSKIRDQANFANQIFTSAVNMFNVDYLGISMLDLFTKDEIFILWQVSNIYMYHEVGPSGKFGKQALKSASLLLNDILTCADKAVKERNISADLRFGHDSYIIPLLALMDVKNMNGAEVDPQKVYQAWCDYKVSPMGVNLQIIFYTNASNDVIIRLLHNEKEVSIPVKTNIAPYYRWADIKDYYEKKIASLK